jgi:peroxiredoxin
MTIKTGDRLPDVEFRVMSPDGPKPVRTAEVFGGKRTALFAVPGAFTPTCSARHLPGFKDRAGDLKAKGIDQIVCVSVNDAWVMGAWGEAQGVGADIVMLADGSGEFTRAIRLEMDAAKFGLGQRSQRYSMVVDDGVVEQLNVEQAGQFEVSTADFMVEHL